MRTFAPLSPDPPDCLSTWFQRCETAARLRFTAELAKTDAGVMSAWFGRLLDNRFLPSLERIGFDKVLTKTMMAMAAPAWESMGPLPENGICFYPGLTKNIEEIRSSIKKDSLRQSENRIQLRLLRPSELHPLANRNAKPAELFTLFEKINTSWLILPRTRHTLTRQDSRCLPVYLQYLESEDEPDLKKALTRVMIEYIGNYTLAYRRSDLPEANAEAVLFFGYTALFWRNLRQPPAGFEDDLVCDHFFRWAQRLRNKSTLHKLALEESLARMSAARQCIFPQPDAFGRIPGDNRHLPEASLMALRNGEPGIASVLHRLGPSAILYKNATASRIPYINAPACVLSLLRAIKAQWSAEAPATCGNIRRFLFELADRYRIAWERAAAADDPAAQTLRFVAPRIRQMIHAFTASLF